MFIAVYFSIYMTEDDKVLWFMQKAHIIEMCE